ncbi:hypothetical protein [Arsenicibacter rosenii]|uniref:Uncharacterized protein n=1 Tax=Arsenicibacter rosenii TaxID=1750698 RepID=A0A1S2VGL4_9BACT|nr:hypothetical protein [Arsenicibacter rosenii]OIN57907.1 hypothetical protein BLX24_17605 [Arsenicibacter rosenii]
MKRFLTLFLGLYLSTVSIVPTAVWEECVKLPQLWEHYELHRAAAPDLSLIDFLSLHYGAGSARHQNQHDHSQIPFKASHHCLGLNWHIAFVPVNLLRPSLIDRLVFILAQRPNFHYHSPLLTERTFSFFHPPKLFVR